MSNEWADSRFQSPEVRNSDLPVRICLKNVRSRRRIHMLAHTTEPWVVPLVQRYKRHHHFIISWMMMMSSISVLVPAVRAGLIHDEVIVDYWYGRLGICGTLLSRALD